MRAVETVLRRHAEDGDRPLVEVTAADGSAVAHSYREVTRAARALDDRVAAATETARSGGRIRVGVLCGDTPESLVADLALLALRATNCPVPPGASARTAATLLAGVSAVLADAHGLGRLAAWEGRGVLPAGCPVLPLDVAALTEEAAGAYRVPDDDRDWICTILPATPATGPGPGAGAPVGIRAHAVTALLDAVRAEVPAATFARCAATLPLWSPAHRLAATPLTLADGGCLVLPPAGVAPAALPGWTAAVRPTALAVTPAWAVALIAAARTARREGAPLPAAVFGTPGLPLLWCGPEVPEALLREFDGLGLPVYAGYGLPESTGPISWNTPAARRAGTVGRPLAHVRAEIAADGELLVSGPGLAVPLPAHGTARDATAHPGQPLGELLAVPAPEGLVTGPPAADSPVPEGPSPRGLPAGEPGQDGPAAEGLVAGGAGDAGPPSGDGRWAEPGGSGGGPRMNGDRLHTGVRATIDADGFIHLVRPARTGTPGQPVSAEVGRLLYSLVRSMRAACVVAFDGTADGSLVQLAAGARANGTGRVVGHVPDAHRAADARTRLTAAGLNPWAEVRHSGLHDLGRAPTLVDLALLDCRPELTLPALTALERRMRPGTIVLALGSAPTGPYLDRVSDGEDYFSMPLSVGSGLEVSIRLTPAPGSSRPGTPPAAGPATPTPQPSGE
ncbi:AMP-binding protein [Streptomyces sp. NPDC096012]|uniref:AMP-binding protein n=1 Tax=Streptomyces sp. NPDC096012 TaxID=3155684 RepID=UPI00336AE73C